MHAQRNFFDAFLLLDHATQNAIRPYLCRRKAVLPFPRIPQSLDETDDPTSELLRVFSAAFPGQPLSQPFRAFLSASSLCASQLTRLARGGVGLGRHGELPLLTETQLNTMKVEPKAIILISSCFTLLYASVLAPLLPDSLVPAWNSLVRFLKPHFPVLCYVIRSYFLQELHRFTQVRRKMQSQLRIFEARRPAGRCDLEFIIYWSYAYLDCYPTIETYPKRKLHVEIPSQIDFLACDQIPTNLHKFQLNLGAFQKRVNQFQSLLTLIPEDEIEIDCEDTGPCGKVSSELFGMIWDLKKIYSQAGISRDLPSVLEYLMYSRRPAVKDEMERPRYLPSVLRKPL
jgi:hypothetical protein